MEREQLQALADAAERRLESADATFLQAMIAKQEALAEWLKWHGMLMDLNMKVLDEGIAASRARAEALRS